MRKPDPFAKTLPWFFAAVILALWVMHLIASNGLLR